MLKYYFEDFSVGDRWEFAPWEVTRDDIVAFAQVHDPQPMHVDETAAAALPFGGLIASGWQTALKCATPFISEVMSRTVNFASPGLDEIRWHLPVRPGDVITPGTEVTETALLRSKPDRGRVHFAFFGHNQAGALVLASRTLFFIARRDGEI